jgi:hypothetical protein
MFFEEYAMIFASAGFRTILRQDIRERDYALKLPGYKLPAKIAGNGGLYSTLRSVFGQADLWTRNIRVLLERMP